MKGGGTMTKTLLANTTIEDAERIAKQKKWQFEKGEADGCRYLDLTGQDTIIMENEDGRGVLLIEGAYKQRFEDEKKAGKL